MAMQTLTVATRFPSSQARLAAIKALALSIASALADSEQARRHAELIARAAAADAERNTLAR